MRRHAGYRLLLQVQLLQFHAAGKLAHDLALARLLVDLVRIGGHELLNFLLEGFLVGDVLVIFRFDGQQQVRFAIAYVVHRPRATK